MNNIIKNIILYIMGNICSYLVDKYQNYKKYKKFKNNSKYISIYNNISNIENKKNQIITPLFDCNISTNISNNNNNDINDNFYRKI